MQQYIISHRTYECKVCFLFECYIISFIQSSRFSVFIRNCDNCLVVAVCQQLRLRDCHNCSKLLINSLQFKSFQNAIMQKYICFLLLDLLLNRAVVLDFLALISIISALNRTFRKLIYANGITNG